MSAIDMQPEEGTLRLMTPGEIAMARRIYGDSIVYSRVWIHCDSYLPFGWQHPQFAMTPNGELWLRKEKYVADYSKASVSIDLKHLFIHEFGARLAAPDWSMGKIAWFF